MLDIKVPKCYRNPNPDGKIAPAGKQRITFDSLYVM